MTKNIIIGILTFMCVVFYIYAKIKASTVERQTILAKQNLILAKENQGRARAEEQKAIQVAAKAMIFEKRAKELSLELEKCKN